MSSARRVGGSSTTLCGCPGGGVLSYDFRRGPVYRVGWRLLWHVDDAGTAPANTAWRSSHATNIGDPRLRSVDVVADNAPTRCTGCHATIGAVKVSIRDGIIAGVVVLSEIDVDASVHAVVLDPESGEPVEELSSSLPIDMRP
jgi:hypothetical protein